MADLISLIFENLPKINEKTFFQSSTGFGSRKDQTIIKKYYGDKNPKWPTKNQDGVKLTLFHLKIDWNATYQANLKPFLHAKCLVLAERRFPGM
jgi:hypothetical protein